MRKMTWFHAAVFVYMLEIDGGFAQDHIGAKHFGTNYWVIFLMLLLFVYANIFLIGWVVRGAKGRSVFDILETSMPKSLLYPIYCVLTLLWLLLSSTISRDYGIIYQLLAFPSRKFVFLLILYMLLMYFLLMLNLRGIMRAMTCFFFIVIWIPLLLFYFIPEWEYLRFTPFFLKNATNTVDLQTWIKIYRPYVGFEMALLLIPYFDKGGRWVKGLFIGQTLAGITNMAITFVVSGYFSLGQLQKLAYPILSLLSYIEFSFLNRIEILSLSIFLFHYLSKSVIYAFGALLILRRIFPGIQVTWLALGITIFVYVAAWPFRTIRFNEKMFYIMSGTEIGLAVLGPIILLILISIQQRLVKGRV